MASTGKLKLKAPLESWLSGLDSCFQIREQWDATVGRPVARPLLIRLAKPEHTGWLRRLLAADYSPIISRLEANAYFKDLEASGKAVPVDRSKFPAGHQWDIIKKWNLWKRLRVIPRIEAYVNAFPQFWKNYCQQHGGPVSPFTSLWIHHQNLVNTHHFLHQERSSEKLAQIDRQFPAVAIMQRIQQGCAPVAGDIKKLEPLASSWCKEHAIPVQAHLKRGLGRQLALQSNRLEQQLIDDVKNSVDVLYAALLAADVQAQHQRSMTAVAAWNREWDVIAAGFLRALGNERYIRTLREIIPLSRAGDPTFEQQLRKKAAKKASQKRNPRLGKAKKKTHPKSSAAGLA
jgi:hypothetical protein